MKAKKLIRGQFNPQYERKQWPMPPRSICRNAIHRFLGIVSPTLYFMRNDAEAKDYEFESLRYLCYRRRLTGGMWKQLYREVRIRERKLLQQYRERGKAQRASGKTETKLGFWFIEVE